MRMRDRCFVCLFCFFASLVGFAQQKDTVQHSIQRNEMEELKLNKETLEAIKAGTLIGPMPERWQQRHYSENELLEGNIPKESEMTNRDSIPALRLSREDIRRLKAYDKVYHRKKTVNDPQTIANPHINLSFDNLLSFLFRPDLRQQMRNKKRATAYKTY